MSLLTRLFNRAAPTHTDDNEVTKTCGELIAEMSNGANLIDGKQTWELAQENKNDIECMKKCCEAELKTMEAAGIVPAPFYFERVAILSRKQKNYIQEIEYCELYINTVKSFYKVVDQVHHADVRKGPRYKAIVERLSKAKELHASNQ
jgi:hypothetical protein